MNQQLRPDWEPSPLRLDCMEFAWFSDDNKWEKINVWCCRNRSTMLTTWSHCELPFVNINFLMGVSPVEKFSSEEFSKPSNIAMNTFNYQRLGFAIYGMLKPTCSMSSEMKLCFCETFFDLLLLLNISADGLLIL